LPIQKAREKGLKIDWSKKPPVKAPTFLGEKVFEDFPLERLISRIDWNPFFAVWQIKGKYPHRGYPKIFDDPTVGAEAKKLHNTALDMLKEIVTQKQLVAKGILAFYASNSDGDDIVMYEDETRHKEKGRLHGLRQQMEKDTEEPFLCLSDFIAPKGHADYSGFFAVSIFGAEELCKKYNDDDDDYNIIMIKALADRLAEAFAEVLHEEVRKDYWGYVQQEQLDTDQLLKVQYQGVRPAPGYPSQPDHTEKLTMWKVAQIKEKTGIELSESLSMMPAASVSALLFAHEQSKYFAVGKINKDQVEDYAKRKQTTVQEVESNLSSIIGYE